MDCTAIMEKIASRTRREVTLMCDAPPWEDRATRWIAICDATRSVDVGGRVASLVFGRGATPDHALLSLLRQLEVEPEPVVSAP